MFPNFDFFKSRSDAMQHKKGFIMKQKPNFSLTNKKFKSLNCNFIIQ
ncbi:MAG: hypothetical protein TRG1_2540 [Flavobacteriaceae bacterium FS1-H7996/R]|nr:MAG: hypothetical protein TRG1_2540 [Flavobacteriaceae bacterium FS1-H7996/R]